VFLIPLIRSLASKHRTRVVAVILLLSEIMPTCSRYMSKRLVCVVIMAPLGYQPSSCAKCTKLNIRSSYDVRSVSNAKCICLIRSYILRSLQLSYLIYLRVLYNSYYKKT
jgi:hypothetical protein